MKKFSYKNDPLLTVDQSLSDVPEFTDNTVRMLVIGKFPLRIALFR